MLEALRLSFRAQSALHLHDFLRPCPSLPFLQSASSQASNLGRSSLLLLCAEVQAVHCALWRNGSDQRCSILRVAHQGASFEDGRSKPKKSTLLIYDPIFPGYKKHLRTTQTDGNVRQFVQRPFEGDLRFCQIRETSRTLYSLSVSRISTSLNFVWSISEKAN